MKYGAIYIILGSSFSDHTIPWPSAANLVQSIFVKAKNLLNF